MIRCGLMGPRGAIVVHVESVVMSTNTLKPKRGHFLTGCLGSNTPILGIRTNMLGDFLRNQTRRISRALLRHPPVGGHSNRVSCQRRPFLLVTRAIGSIVGVIIVTVSCSTTVNYS